MRIPCLSFILCVFFPLVCVQLHPFSIWKNCRYVPLSYFTLRPLITSSRLPIFSQCVAIILLSSSALSLPYYPTFLEQNEGQQEVTEKVTAPVWRCCYQFWLIISFLVFPSCTSTFPPNIHIFKILFLRKSV